MSLQFIQKSENIRDRERERGRVCLGAYFGEVEILIKIALDIDLCVAVEICCAELQGITITGAASSCLLV